MDISAAGSLDPRNFKTVRCQGTKPEAIKDRGFLTLAMMPVDENDKTGDVDTNRSKSRQRIRVIELITNSRNFLRRIQLQPSIPNKHVFGQTSTKKMHSLLAFSIASCFFTCVASFYSHPPSLSYNFHQLSRASVVAGSQTTSFPRVLPIIRKNFGTTAFQNYLNQHKLRRSGHQSIRGLRAMFTGIVEEMGKVINLAEDPTLGVTLTIGCNVVTEGAYIGCSIAVNGVCLTVTEYNEHQFKVLYLMICFSSEASPVNCLRFQVGISPETLRLTNLGALRTGNAVNLERAAAMNGRNSGHMVQGHIDNVGEIIET
jgi:hypothetical protein